MNTDPNEGAFRVTRDGLEGETGETVTITIPLEDAEALAKLLDRRCREGRLVPFAFERRVIEAIRAELRRRA